MMSLSLRKRDSIRVASQIAAKTNNSRRGQVENRSWPSTEITPIFRCACGGSCPRCAQAEREGKKSKPKFRISRPGDAFEREADRIADQIARSPVENLARDRGQNDLPTQRLGSQVLARQADEEAEETPGKDEESFPREEEEEEETITGDESGRPKRRDGAGQTMSRVSVPRGSGSSMAPSARAFAQASLGHDFSRVRIHTDTEAARSAESIGARAYTLGENIYFGKDEYAPDSSAGRRLLAHELAHVVQRRQKSASLPDILPACGNPTCRRTPPRVRTGGCNTRDCVGSRADRCSPHCGNESCPTTENQDPAIRRIEVYRDEYYLRIFPRRGSSRRLLRCSPSLSAGRGGKKATPLGTFRIGQKCTACHTNRCGDGMAWFSGLDTEGLGIGFHDSQRVARGEQSHGCIRVHCGLARRINRESSTATVVEIVRRQAPSPRRGGGSAASSRRTYVVRSGDGWGIIAQRHGVTEAALRAANRDLERRRGDRIHIGDTMVIPGS